MMRFFTFVLLIFTFNLIGAQEVLKFIPEKKLIKNKQWTRVSEFRFEDEVSYVAIEWQNNTYVLMDMGTNGKIYQKSKTCKPLFKFIRTLCKQRFIPNEALQNKEFWNRVSMFRFECEALQLVVEWHAPEFVLFSLHNSNLAYERSKDFHIIEAEIRELTIHNRNRKPSSDLN